MKARRKLEDGPPWPWRRSGEAARFRKETNRKLRENNHDNVIGGK